MFKGTTAEYRHLQLVLLSATVVSSLVSDKTCKAGYVCSPGSGGYEECPSGNYCPANSTSPIACRVGTYRHSTMGTSITDCTLCPVGMYCDAPALTSPTGTCDAGYFCGPGNTSPTPDGTQAPGGMCLVGFYCSAGSLPIQCAPGYYNNKTGQSSCMVCPEGHACPMGSISPIPCQPGTFSNSTGHMVCYDCPQGYYCPPGSVMPTECAAGSYNEWPGQSTCKTCPAGTYCQPGSTAPHRCPGGSYSNAGRPACRLCPVGHMCPPGQPIECPRGTYNDQIGSTCKSCPGGSYCPGGSIRLICPSPQANCDH